MAHLPIETFVNNIRSTVDPLHVTVASHVKGVQEQILDIVSPNTVKAVAVHAV
jgi:uncharacterized radical SAM superfamily protein